MFSKRIPQLNELNNYLKNKTGFQIKPTHGILSQREFLNCFAFRVFCCTQYLRHTKTPDYTPEPDIVHEIVGHVPMFADPDVAVLFILHRNFLNKLDCSPWGPLTNKFPGLALSTGSLLSSVHARKVTRNWVMVQELPAVLQKLRTL